MPRGLKNKPFALGGGEGRTVNAKDGQGGGGGGYTYPSVWAIKHDHFISTVILLRFHLSGHSPSAGCW